MASEGLTGDRIRRDPVSKPGSSELDFRRYHTHRRERRGLFCLTIQPAARRGQGCRVFGSLTAFVICCGQISPRSQNTQSGEKLFAWVPLRNQAFSATESAVNPQQKVRASGIFRGKGRCVDGSSRVPPVGTRVRHGDVFA